MSKIQLQIRSADRQSGTTSNFAINLTRSFNIRKWRVQYVNIPNQIWNITAQNNRIQFNSGSSIVATISPGYYSNATLITAVGNAMTVADGVNTYTVTQSNLLTVINSTGSFQLDYTNSTLLRYLGFTTASGLSPLSGSITSNTAITLSPATIYVNISGFTSNLVSTNQVTASFIVPMLANNGQFNIITDELLMGQKIETVEKSYTSMNITLLDEYSNNIDLKADWSFILVECN